MEMSWSLRPELAVKREAMNTNVGGRLAGTVFYRTVQRSDILWVADHLRIVIGIAYLP